ncbi:ABC transporter permease [Methylobacterium gossipiicola]|uniref:Oligopeptide transport system permease protein n=1 Tax=Methylobacterium gossipiicola TaxID=582675 RepID=A0A1I2SQE4_9HYPH|nr:ABC transporter permease subunit [Methylobacterium gossipiicola]SFG54970.1 oligopeptide transport system permease protein [Methylobacterium gossipiicola]
MRRLGRRLARDRSALVAFGVLAMIGLACWVGPLFTGHAPERIYPDLVAVPPGLAPHPRPETVAPALEGLAFRMRATATEIAARDGQVRFVLAAPSPIDPRVLTYLPRSDLFGPATILAREADGRRLVVTAPILARTFFLGTDGLGRDLLTRTLVAGRVSLVIGLVATAVALAIGLTYGAVAGYVGGRVDAMMMRVVDGLYALPFMFFVIMLLVFFDAGLGLILVAIGAVEWLDMARMVRTQTLSLRRRDFVRAAEALGLSSATILRRHIVPNTLGPVAVAATLLVPRVILLESFLSFLGLGVQEPDTSWGALIAEGARSLEAAPWMLGLPAAALVATLLALNVFGDALGRALDPRGDPR